MFKLFFLTNLYLFNISNSPKYNPSHCFTALSGTEELFESIIRYSTKTLTSVLNSFPVLQLDSLYRSKLYSILNSNKVGLM